VCEGSLGGAFNLAFLADKAVRANEDEKSAGVKGFGGGGFLPKWRKASLWGKG